MNWNSWLRQAHRWLSIAFTVTVIANFAIRAGRTAGLDYLFATAFLFFVNVQRLVLVRHASGVTGDAARETGKPQLTIVRTIDAPPEAVFAAFVEPDKSALWWGPDDGPVLVAEVDPRVGGRFDVRFLLAKDGSEHGSSGVFEVFEAPRRLSMSWAWDDEDGPNSHVDVTFRAVSGGTEISLVHSRLLDAETRDSHAEGWSGAFDKLKAKAGEFALSPLVRQIPRCGE